jgi:N-acetylneuraminate lyase
MPKFDLSDAKGVIPALVTPFDKDEKFDEGRMRNCVDFLVNRGVGALYTTGSTGETFLMSPDERAYVVEVVVDQVKGRIPVIAHVGAIGTRLSVDLAQRAQAAGVDAISSVPPFYWPFTADQVANYYTDVTKSTDLPMVVYNIPLAGVLGFDQIKKLAAIPAVGGIKYTAATVFDYLRIKEEIGPDFRVFSGSDELAMAGLGFGADAIIGSFYNLIPEVFIAIFDAIVNNDVARAKELQATANAIIFFSLNYSATAVIKRGMAWQGADAGYCRKPFDNFLTETEEEDLKDAWRRLKRERNIEGVAFLDAI